MTKNQTPEQIARDKIDKILRTPGWTIQNRNDIDFSAGLGVAIHEYQTEVENKSSGPRVSF